MTSLSDKFPNHKGSSKYGGRYLVLDDCGHKSASFKFKLRCVVCDKEVFSSPEKIFIGQKPCACGRHYYKTPERKLEKILEVSKKKGIFPVNPNVQLKNSSERFEVFCGECDHKWEVSFTYFAHMGRGCPSCSKQKRYTDEEYIERVNDVGIFKNFIFHSKACDSKLRTHTRVNLECLVCKNVWRSSLSNTLSGKYSCPSCARLGFNPNRPSHIYLLGIKRGGEIVGYKYGISNVKRKRLSNLTSYNKGVELKCIASWYYYVPL